MRLAVLLTVLLSACATPVVVPTKAPVPSKETPKPACFAPAGTYLSFATLKSHNCRTPPPNTVGTAVETVAPGSIPCGLRRLDTTIEGIPTLMLFMVGANGMAGSMAFFPPGCRAIYAVRFIRLGKGGKGKEI